MTMRLIQLTIAILGACAATAEEYVDKADANDDGFVSLYELRAAHYADPEFNRRIEQMFARYDRDGDGRISDAERRVASGGTQETATSAPPATHGQNVAAGGLQPDGVVTASTAAGTSLGSGAVATPSNEIRELDTTDLRAQKRTVTRPDNQVSVSSAKTTANSKEGQRSSSRGTAQTGTEAWIRDVDKDGSGGASAAELLASSNGQRWFSKDEFKAADRNDDGDLDATELDVLVRSLERRHR